MRFIYSQWDSSLAARLKGMKDLMSIFNHLLLQVNGDVELALQAMEQLQKLGYLPADADLDAFRKELENQRYVTMSTRHLKLTQKGERGLRRDAFDRVFERLKLSGNGDHNLPHDGGNTEELLPERRRFQHGDELHRIDFRKSLLNSISRSASLGLNLSEDDLEVCETDRATNSATAVLIDISHSMILYGEDRITPAKQVALAFTELVLTRFPKDSLHVILFGDFAAEIQIKDLPYREFALRFPRIGEPLE